MVGEAPYPIWAQNLPSLTRSQAARYSRRERPFYFKQAEVRNRTAYSF